MTTATVHPRRNWPPTIAFLIAGGAVALSVVALTADDVGTTTPVRTPAPADTVAALNVPVHERMPTGWPATEIMRRHVETEAQSRRDAELMPPGWPATEVMRSPRN